MKKKFKRWKTVALFILAGIFALATVVSILALASISGIGSGLIVLAAMQLTLSPIAFVTLTTIISLGLTALTAAAAAYFYKELANPSKKDAPQVIYMSRPKHLDTPHLEWAAKRNQMKELLLQSERRPVYANIPKGLQTPDEGSEDSAPQFNP